MTPYTVESSGRTNFVNKKIKKFKTSYSSGKMSFPIA